MPRGIPKNGINKGWFKKGRKNSKELLEKISGEKSMCWVGDKIGYQGIHSWIIRQFGKANICENPDCIYPRKGGLGSGRWLLKPKRFDWANISGKYLRDRNDFIQLCRSCHEKWDKGFININLDNYVSR